MSLNKDSPISDVVLDGEQFSQNPLRYASSRLLVIREAARSLRRNITIAKDRQWFNSAGSLRTRFLRSINYTFKFLLVSPFHWIRQRVLQLAPTVRQEQLPQDEDQNLASTIGLIELSITGLQQTITLLNLKHAQEHQGELAPDYSMMRPRDLVPTESPRELLYTIIFNIEQALPERLFKPGKDPQNILDTLGEKMEIPQTAQPKRRLGDGTPTVYFLCVGKPGHGKKRTMVVGASGTRWSPFIEAHEIRRQAIRIGDFERSTSDAYRQLQAYEDAVRAELAQEWTSAGKRFLPKDLTFPTRLETLHRMDRDGRKIGGLGEYGQAYGQGIMQLMPPCYACRALYAWSTADSHRAHEETAAKKEVLNSFNWDTNGRKSHACAETAACVQCMALLERMIWPMFRLTAREQRMMISLNFVGGDEFWCLDLGPASFSFFL